MCASNTSCIVPVCSLTGPIGQRVTRPQRRLTVLEALQIVPAVLHRHGAAELGRHPVRHRPTAPVLAPVGRHPGRRRPAQSRASPYFFAERRMTAISMRNAVGPLTAGGYGPVMTACGAPPTSMVASSWRLPTSSMATRPALRSATKP